jgi:hypothetical protein
MNRQETINELRALADMMEAAPALAGDIRIKVGAHSVRTRKDLAAWLAAISGLPEAWARPPHNWITITRVSPYESEVTMFHPLGLLDYTVEKVSEKVTERVTITETPAELLAAEGITQTPDTGATDGND